MAASNDFERAAESLRPDHALSEPMLREAAALMRVRRFGLAGKLLREYLGSHSRDARAMHLLAENAALQGRIGDAMSVLARCASAAPDAIAPRYAYANLLLRANSPQPALAEAEVLLHRDPNNPMFRRLKANALEALENYDASGAIWRALMADYPDYLQGALRYGHALRLCGARDEAIAAYRDVIAREPSSGDAWWSLADLKTFHFTDSDIAVMESQIRQSDLRPEDRVRIHFALGKAYDGRKAYENAFDNYAKANSLYRGTLQHEPDTLTAYVARCKNVFTAEFFRQRVGLGHDARDPIFLVGMPRAGSTLVEQILASHSQIEGTKELFDLAAISRQLQAQMTPETATGYPQGLARLDAASLKALGEAYLETTRAHRKLARPFFTDKMGANFVHAGLIRMILPNAKIVDVRRHPMACGFSMFAQLFPKGENQAYRLSDIGRFYRDYADLMAHFDAAMPGAVHRVFYEQLVADPEAEVRRLLAYLELPFEESCLTFYKTERVVTTASSEQVRRPITKEALDHWRHYGPWLGPLKDALGPALDAYPHARET